MQRYIKRPLHLSHWHIPQADAQQQQLKNGVLLHQSLSKYLVHTDLYEYQLSGQEHFTFQIDKSAIVMCMMLEGQTSLLDENKELIMEVKAPCYFLMYIPKGNYSLKLNAGTPKILIFIPLPEWFIRHTERLKEFEILTEKYQAKSTLSFSLPHCGLKKSIISRLEKVFSKLPKQSNISSPGISIFLSDLFARYKEALTYNNYTTSAIHQAKAKAISLYLQQHFREHAVDDICVLAKKFGLSDRNLSRISQSNFGCSIRKYIINLRMNHAMNLIVTTNLTIQDIALQSGYNDAHYFSRAFKKHFKKNPASFRQ